MANEMLRLHPKNYCEVNGRIIFYLDHKYIGNEQMIQSVVEEMQNARTLVITSVRKKQDDGRRYMLFLRSFIIPFTEGKSENFNFYSSKIISGRQVKERKSELYKKKIFTVIPSGEVLVVYKGKLYPVKEDTGTNWSMEEEQYRSLCDPMEDYFEQEELLQEEDDKEEKIEIKERFRRNIIRPFRDYSDKEDWVERLDQMNGEGITYFKRVFGRKNEKGSTYRFYSSDACFEPGEGNLDTGSKVEVFAYTRETGGFDGDSKRKLVGTITDIDCSSEQETIFEIAFYYQFDDEELTQTGKMIPAVNDTQTRVRNRVAKSIERTQIESKYMYRTFTDFSTAGYEQPGDDLASFLAGKIDAQYPPNQMQMEAVIKGILTKDLLLVLGPPGTGKTTVISQWVEYFVRHNQRVLISSQNNAAVDNVLARFKGKGTEIVRLGNESKVQMDCREFLPVYKIKSMQESFDRNAVRIHEQREHDKKEMERYSQCLQELEKSIQEYIAAEKGWKQFTGTVFTAMNGVKQLQADIDRQVAEIENCIEGRAHKQIFLEQMRQKNAVVRFLNRRYIRRVTAELTQTDERLIHLQKQYESSIERYNGSIRKLDEAMKAFREDKQASGFLVKHEVLREKIQGIMNGQVAFYPDLQSEFKNQYSRPKFSAGNIAGNLSVIQRAGKQIKELEGRMLQAESYLNEWEDVISSDRNDIMQNILLESCQIVGATCIGINSNRDFANVKFDVAIVDESGQIQIHNALIPMTRASKNLLLGDYKQIPPVANEKVIAACEEDGIDTELLNKSFFEYLFEKMRGVIIKDLEKEGKSRDYLYKPVLEEYHPAPNRRMDESAVKELIGKTIGDPKKVVYLNSQFRMPGSISDVISEWFYENNYFSSYDMKRFAPVVPGTVSPMVVISTSKSKGRFERQPENKMGYINAYEADLIADMIAHIIAEIPSEKKQAFCESIESQIGIISAYGAQVRLIRERLQKKKLPISGDQIRSMVASLDSFQGQERPLILYSLTRSTEYKSKESARVGFMKELRRLNVAFTRCQKQLVVLGDIQYLTECMYIKPQAGEEEEQIPRPCDDWMEREQIGAEEIAQCAECTAECERKFARFIKLMLQHIRSGQGDYHEAESFRQGMRKQS